MNLHNAKIHVFPSSIARTNNPTAKIITEHNLIKLITSNTSQDSFVISESFDKEGTFEFVIHGYYVLLTSTPTSPLLFTGTPVYAHIFIDTSSPTNPQLWGHEDAGQDIFTAVEFTDTETATPPDLIKDSYEHYALCILTKNGNSYDVPWESRKTIDGGLIE